MLESVELRGERFPWQIAFFLYVSSYGLVMFFLRAYFWDDWLVNYQMSATEAKTYWETQLGFFSLNRFIEVDLLHRNPTAFHLLTLIIFFLIPVVVFYILKYLPIINFKQRVYLVLILLVLPINSARFSMSTFRLSYSYLLFLVAWLVLVEKRTSRWKYLSLPLFLISFLAQSLIPFFLLPCMHVVYLGYLKHGKIHSRFVLNSCLLFLLAPAYLVCGWVFDPPEGDRVAYFTPSILGIIRALFVLGLATVLVVYSVARNHSKKRVWGSQNNLALALFATVLGSTAYMAAGRLVDISEWILNFVPRASDWESRHQLLLGLGIALLISTLIISLNIEVQKVTLFAVLGLCVVLNLSMMQGYFLDSLKQQQIMIQIANLKTANTWNSVTVVDEATVFNARGRGIRSYEWEAMIQSATGNDHVLVSTSLPVCSVGQKQYVSELLIVGSGSGRFNATLKRDPGITLNHRTILRCD
jgi:hypothetical protein